MWYDLVKFAMPVRNRTPKETYFNLGHNTYRSNLAKAQYVEYLWAIYSDWDFAMMPAEHDISHDDELYDSNRGEIAWGRYEFDKFTPREPARVSVNVFKTENYEEDLYRVEDILESRFAPINRQYHVSDMDIIVMNPPKQQAKDQSAYQMANPKMFPLKGD